MQEEISEIKFDIVSSKIDDGMKLFGELLGYLRKTKAMSALMICRQIKNIEIIDGVAVLSGDDDISSLDKNEKLKGELLPFFLERGLGFKVKEKEIKITAEDELKKMLGSKLVIKN